MNIVVTGANGFIGYHTTKRLLELGHHVKAVDLNVNKLSTLAFETNLDVHQIDFTSPAFENCVEASDKILHLGAVAHFVGRPESAKAVHTNVQGTINVLEACVEKRAERLVYSSTGSVYAQGVEVPIREDAPLGPSEDNYYGWSKLMAEQWIRNYQRFVPHVILRYAYVYGPLKDWGAIGAFLKKLGNSEAPVVFGGNQSNDFIYVDDVVDANIRALETTYINQSFNIGTGRATSIRDACEYCIDASGKQITMKVEPARSFDYDVFLYNIDKARTLLKFEPNWNLLRGIARMVTENGKLQSVAALQHSLHS